MIISDIGTTQKRTTKIKCFLTVKLVITGKIQKSAQSTQRPELKQKSETLTLRLYLNN